jgi:NAD(P)H dehydrogenase (quinone)
MRYSLVSHGKELCMRKIAIPLVFSLFVGLWMSPSAAQQRTTILISYYSQQGHTRTMAEAVARGAQSVGAVTVKLRGVAETTKEDLLAADAVIVGSPVHNANAAAEIISFLNHWPFEGAPMKDKIGAAFVTGGGISAGEELAQLNILHSMLIFGMIVVGGPDWTMAFGASAITGEPPFDKSGSETGVAPEFVKKGEALGRRVAELAMKWKQNR